MSDICAPKVKMECGCECVEDPSVRELRRRLCGLTERVVTVISNNFFAIFTGTVDKVTCGTVELIDATNVVVGAEVGRVIITLTNINDVIVTTERGGLKKLPKARLG
jgi:hypothetical protein